MSTRHLQSSQDGFTRTCLTSLLDSHEEKWIYPAIGYGIPLKWPCSTLIGRRCPRNRMLTSQSLLWLCGLQSHKILIHVTRAIHSRRSRHCLNWLGWSSDTDVHSIPKNTGKIHCQSANDDPQKSVLAARNCGMCCSLVFERFPSPIVAVKMRIAVLSGFSNYFHP